MSGARHPGDRSVPVEAIGAHPDRIDVRSPLEYAHDRVPGAHSHPVLDDAERARIGTLHAMSPFEARKTGAALIARNIAAMLEHAFSDRGRDWRPLVYCWRGGQRSRALTHILNEVGWRAVQLDGGYRAYRRHVVNALHTLPRTLELVVIAGLTGSGKSRLLSALAAEGAQTIDLEQLARHRGSLLGDLPGHPQPTQKWFESQLHECLAALDPTQPVYVESESRRIGSVQVPDVLLERMRDAATLRLRTSRPLRVALLCEEYAHFRADPEALRDRLAPLTPLHGKATLERWHAAALAGDWESLLTELLDQHYDPTYGRSLARNFAAGGTAVEVDVDDVSPAAFSKLARGLIEREPQPTLEAAS